MGFRQGEDEMKLSWPHNLVLNKYYLPIKSFTQPDDCSCGLCCLKIVLSFLGREVPFDALEKMMPPLYDIGLYDSQIGKTALDLGFSSTIYTYNYRIFHPIWNRLDRGALIGKLLIKQSCAMTPYQALAAQCYILYLQEGGDLFFYPLSKEMIIAHLAQGLPVIAALDMSFLYDCTAFYDEFSEHRATHFIVIHGYNPEDHTFHVSDPWHSIPLPHDKGQYIIDADRVINAIFLGEYWNDASILVIQQKR
jgi:hypothetical protein